MRVLGICTATRIASVGVEVRGEARAERTLPMSGSHASTLLPLIGEVTEAAALRVAEIDVVAVSIGPGSFTGLRIGLSVAKGLALACGAALVGIPTLEAYAHAAGPRSGTVWPVLDARKGEVYAAGFRWRGAAIECIAPAQAMSPRALAERVAPPSTLVGDGVDAYAELWASSLGDRIERLGLSARPPSGLVVARLGAERCAGGGADDLALIEPTYCRLPEAEIHRDRRVAAMGIV